MTTAADHFERLLATHYTWMLGGDVVALAAEQARVLKSWGYARAEPEPGPSISAADRDRRA